MVYMHNCINLSYQLVEGTDFPMAITNQLVIKFLNIWRHSLNYSPEFQQLKYIQNGNNSFVVTN